MPRLPLLLAAAVIAGAAAPAAGSVQALMKSVVDPSANLLFAVGGEVDPANGPDAAKVPAARWTEGAEAARKVKAVAMRMRAAPLARDEAEWKAFVAQMESTAATAQAAALAHDGARLSQAANDLSDSCAACHAKYKPQGG